MVWNRLSSHDQIILKNPHIEKTPDLINRPLIQVCFLHLVQFPLSYNSHSSLVVIRNLTKRCIVKSLKNLQGNKSHRLICVWSWDDSLFVLSASHKHQFCLCRNTELFLGVFSSHHSCFTSHFLFALPSHWLKSMGKACQHKKKAPQNCNTDSNSDHLELCREACQLWERRGTQPPLSSPLCHQ